MKRQTRKAVKIQGEDPNKIPELMELEERNAVIKL